MVNYKKSIAYYITFIRIDRLQHFFVQDGAEEREIMRISIQEYN